MLALIGCLGGGALFSLAPAIRAGRFPLLAALKVGSATPSVGKNRLRATLVGGQVAVTTLLLVAAGLFVRALSRSELAGVGWSMEGVWVGSFDLTLDGTNPAAGETFYQALVDRARRLPGVTAAATAAKLPLGGRSSFGTITVPGLEPPPGEAGYEAYLNRVSPGYFATLGIRLLEGRDFDRTDVEGSPLVAIVNRTMAARLWPGQDPVGRRFDIGSGPFAHSFEVVGVADDVRSQGFGRPVTNFYYVAARQWYNAEQTIHLKVAPGAESGVVAGLRGVVHELDPNLPVPAIRPLTESLAVFSMPQRIAALGAGAMGLFGLLLAVIGVAGITAFAATRRNREIGIRLALGATRWRIVGMMMRQIGLAPVVGTVIGLALGAGFTIGAGIAVPGVQAGDPVALGVAPMVVAVAAFVAIVVPVWRVLRRSPMGTLREE